MDAGVALAITVAGTIGGGVAGAAIGLKGARSLARDERAASERQEIARAYRAYVAAAVKSVSELRQLPPVPEPHEITDAVGAVVNVFRSEADAKMAAKARIHRLYGDRHLVLADQLVTAGVELALREIPPSARKAIEATDDYVIRLSDERSDELTGEWKEIHAALMAAGEDVRVWAESGDLRQRTSRILSRNDDGQRRVETAADPAEASNGGDSDE